MFSSKNKTDKPKPEKKKGKKSSGKTVAEKAIEGHEVGEVTENEAVETILTRNEFYKDSYRKMMMLCLALSVVTIALLGFAYYQFLARPKPVYFATESDGTLIPIIPLEEPNLSDNSLLQWVTEAATASYNYNFVNYREAIQRLREYFTDGGYQQYLKAIRASNNLDAVRDKKLVVSAVPTSAPIITKSGLTREGVFAWRIQMGILVTYQSANEQIKQNLQLQVLVKRVPTIESTKGVGIAQFLVIEQ